MKSTSKTRTRVFLDTNIILDVLSSGTRLHREASRKIIQAVCNGEMEAFITTQSILDTQYVLSKEGSFSFSKFSQVMLFIMSFVNVIQIDGLSIREALKNPTGDFEDDAQFIQADSEGFDVIVTSDRRFLSRQEDNGPLLLSPEGLIARMS
ncbi:MAG: PIN domain-containing protein [Bacteroidales bacterium]|nr:PIN domain-containing protein [Bacteroidales bacterium]